MKKIYIAGRVTGLPYNEVYNKFKNKELQLRALGYSPVNPCDIVEHDCLDWKAAMKQCIKALCDCDYIYLLEDWEESKGARMEKELAYQLGLLIIEQSWK